MAKNAISIIIIFVLMCPRLLWAVYENAMAFDSTTAYNLVSNYPIQPLDAYTSILMDDNQEWTIDRILEEGHPTLFSPIEDSIIRGSHILWLKTSIRSDIAIEDWWLISRREDGLLRYLTRHDRVDVYHVRDGSVAHHSISGMWVPASQKDVPEHITVSRVLASFAKDAQTDLYIRIEDKEVITTRLELRDPVMALPDPNAHTGYMATRVVMNFAFVILCYVFAFFFFTRDRSYLYLAGMLVMLFLHYFLLLPYVPLISWICPEAPSLYGPMWTVLTLGTYVFLFQFGRKFTELDQISLLWDKIILRFIQVLIVIIILKVGLWFLYPELNDFARYPLALFMFLTIVVILIRLAFFKNEMINYYVFGAFWLILFSIFGILWELGHLPLFKSVPPWMIAQGGFILIYGIALARKIQISERARSEVTRIKEIDSIKSKFFANISHEFRTPLSLILGPINQSLESIPSSEHSDKEIEVPVKGKYLNMMRRNAGRLQHLVDQILDLSKLDQGKLQLAIVEGNVIQFIRAIVFSFESLAERRHIHYNTHFHPAQEGAYFDRDKLEKIIVNLLSNAFKFSPEHGSISVSVVLKDKKLEISITDSGPGIAADEIDKIFDRFFQVEGTESKGTGIGLALVKELVELHDGHIVVESTRGQGTSFKVRLPYLKEDFRKEDIVEIASHNEGIANPLLDGIMLADPSEVDVEKSDNDNRDAPVILVVEDNPDLRSYIRDNLSLGYQVLTASDGVAGEEMAISQVPDLVISDVMMPRQSGFELCKALKNDQRTSHIPVVLLTAKADQDNKIEGLQYGADDYLTKPFDVKELNVRITNLLTQRDRLREHYADELQLRPTSIKHDSMEDRFLRDVMTQIEEHMDNEFFTVEELAHKVGFSRSQLARKIKAITGKTSNQLIREFRLIRAKELLDQHAGSVSEIAYQVGYSNLSYFSKSYKEMFGMLPSESAYKDN